MLFAFDFVFSNSAIACLNIVVKGSSTFAGKLLFKLSADFDFQNLSSKSVVDRLIFLNNLYWSKINAQENTELANKRMITNFTTKSALTKSCQREKSLTPPKPTTCAAICDSM